MLSSRSMLGRIIVSHYNTLFAARCKNHNSVGYVPIPLNQARSDRSRQFALRCIVIVGSSIMRQVYPYGSPGHPRCAPTPLSPKLFVDFVSAPPSFPLSHCPLAKHATHSFRSSSLVFRRRSIIFERGPGATRSISLHL